MEKVVEVCSRIEGHADIKIFFNNEQIKYIKLDTSVFRGFETILKGKKLIDIPKIVSRICGLCHASQTIASCKTIENLYEVSPTPQAILLRKLLLSAELIKSHSMHFFFQTLPDLLNIFKLWNNSSEPYEILQYDPQTTTLIYDLIKLGTKINEIFGGRVLHLITPIPGGIIYKPNQKNISLTQKSLQKALFNSQYLIKKFIDLFSDCKPPEDFNLDEISFLGLTNNGTYERYNGELRLKQVNSPLKDFTINLYSNYFEKDDGILGIQFKTDIGENILTGPISRFKINEKYNQEIIKDYINNFDKQWKNSLLFWNFLQLIEIYSEINGCIELLKDPKLNSSSSYPVLKNLNKKEGIAAIEAPRGTLIHYYHLNERNIVDNVKLYVPTELNMPLINKKITDYAHKLYEKEPIDSVMKKVQIMIRSFDPCISCATH
ncbi:MAG: nickel-dependent hydrogenase large subunit [Candidatus Hodarchaeota archaeon]